MADKKDSTPKADDKTQDKSAENPKTTGGDGSKAANKVPASKPQSATSGDPLVMPEESKAAPEAKSPLPKKPKTTKPRSKPEPVKSEPLSDEKTADRVIERRRGFVPALLGGILAAMLGFLAARADLVDQFLPKALQSGKTGAEIAALRDEVAAHDTAISGLSANIEGLPIPDLTPLETGLADLTAQIDPLTERLDIITAELQQIQTRLGPMDDRLTELEKRPLTQGVSQSAIAAYERELQTLQSSVAEQRAEMQALVEQARQMEADARAKEDQAAIAAQKAMNRTAVAQMRAALDSGRPYMDQVQLLESNDVSVPAVLSGPAAEGVATIAALQTDFPPAARNALAAVRAQSADGSHSFGTFLQRQLGARSVAPRDGNDPDAILSRAEAALTNGDLSRALREIDSLTEAAKPPLDGWRERAESRLAAIEAADDLAQSLNAN
ncbi:hypothetical protein [Pontibaca salina]|uniref:Mitochondrial inner membrane protein n=1 Tax=Pontibaca salina TaxID=2795731 RepID=A0A934HJS0_9RHOB|nr:hypothetical protein [Pontibaca salina]MBI6629464.1 hypothetical protein [Pontibaca salina]